MSHRLDIRTILADPCQRKRLFVASGVALQRMAGRGTTEEQMTAAYDRVQEDLVECPRCGLRSTRSAWGQTCGRCFTSLGEDILMLLVDP